MSLCHVYVTVLPIFHLFEKWASFHLFQCIPFTRTIFNLLLCYCYCCRCYSTHTQKSHFLHAHQLFKMGLFLYKQSTVAKNKSLTFHYNIFCLCLGLYFKCLRECACGFWICAHQYWLLHCFNKLFAHFIISFLLFFDTKKSKAQI